MNNEDNAKTERMIIGGEIVELPDSQETKLLLKKLDEISNHLKRTNTLIYFLAIISLITAVLVGLIFGNITAI